MLEFKIFGCKVLISFGFVFLLCAIPYLCGADTMLLISMACIVHEFGHLIAIIMVGVTIRAVRFTVSGINIRCENKYLSKLNALMIYIAGFAANLVATVLLFEINRDLAAANAVVGGYAMLPHYGFDGCSILNIFIKNKTALRVFGIIVYLSIMIYMVLSLFSDSFAKLLTVAYIVMLSAIGED